MYIYPSVIHTTHKTRRFQLGCCCFAFNPGLIPTIYRSTNHSIHPSFLPSSYQNLVRMVVVDEFFSQDETEERGDDLSASPPVVGAGQPPPQPLQLLLATAASAEFTQPPRKEEPSAKRTKKEWLAFVGTKHTRVGDDFQVLSLPVPDRGSSRGGAAADGTVNNHNHGPSGNGHGRSEPVISDDDQGTIATAATTTRTTPSTSHGRDIPEGNENDSL